MNIKTTCQQINASLAAHKCDHGIFDSSSLCCMLDTAVTLNAFAYRAHMGVQATDLTGRSRRGDCFNTMLYWPDLDRNMTNA